VKTVAKTVSYFKEVLFLLSSLRNWNYVWEKLNCGKRELRSIEKKLVSHSYCGKLIQNCISSNNLTVREKDFCKRILQAGKYNIPLSITRPNDLDVIVKNLVSSKYSEFLYVELCNGRKVLYCYSPDEYFGVHHWLAGCCFEDENVKVLTVFFLFPDRQPLVNFMKAQKSNSNTIKTVLLYPFSFFTFLPGKLI